MPANFSRTTAAGSQSTSWLSRRLRVWLVPLVFTVAISIVSLWAHSIVRQTIEADLETDLRTLLAADTEALKTWLGAQIATAEDFARTNVTRQIFADAIHTRSGKRPSEYEPCPQVNELLEHLRVSRQYVVASLLDSSGTFVASTLPTDLGLPLPPPYHKELQQVLRGETVFVLPHASFIPRESEEGTPETGLPITGVVTPIYDDHQKAIGALVLAMDPRHAFSNILQVARSGESGETYAFDSTGLLLSESRFNQHLYDIELLPKGDHSVLQVEIRDPGGNLLTGFAPEQPRDALPLTQMAASAIALGKQGSAEVTSNVRGYRDYRGVPVVGAWQWLPEYGFGVTSEVDLAEAHAPLRKLRQVFWSLLAVMGGTTIGMLAFSARAARLQRKARRAMREAERLGRYQFDEKIGSGAMGDVYRAHHDLLRRPTAVKLLDSSTANASQVKRFEREVQLTSQLTHPNTISVFDFGTTPEGVFYYAMEYLDGLCLQRLVDEHGALPDGRVIHILAQIAGSLTEAHGAGLIHRDIKPANVFLTQRGGMSDFVKVLDFGLVKELAGPETHALTIEGAITGTPMYMAPEQIESGECTKASDIYAFGCVAYFLLTASPVFSGRTLMGLCRQHVSGTPDPPSERTRNVIAPELEEVVLACLAKEPADRPESVRSIYRLLSEIEPSTLWHSHDAQEWWAANLPAGQALQSTSEARLDETVAPRLSR